MNAIGSDGVKGGGAGRPARGGGGGAVDSRPVDRTMARTLLAREGESGHSVRVSDPEVVRSIGIQCASVRISFPVGHRPCTGPGDESTLNKVNLKVNLKDKLLRASW